MAELAAVSATTVVIEVLTLLGGDGGTRAWGFGEGVRSIGGGSMEARVVGARVGWRGRVRVGVRRRVGGVDPNGEGGCFGEGGGQSKSEFQSDPGFQTIDVPVEHFRGGEVRDEHGCLTKGVGVGDDGGSLGEELECIAGQDVLVEGNEGCEEFFLKLAEGGEGLLGPHAVDVPVEGGPPQVGGGQLDHLELGEGEEGDEVADKEEPAKDVGVCHPGPRESRGLPHGLHESRVGGRDEGGVVMDVDALVGGYLCGGGGGDGDARRWCRGVRASLGTVRDTRGISRGEGTEERSGTRAQIHW